MINPSHYDLLSLRIFLLASESGSLTKAAERMHITLSAVSKRIAELENISDCALFIRQPRGLSLTPAGHGMLEHARRILDQVNRMASEMGDYAVGVRGHVRMWVNTSAVIQFLPRDLPAFLTDNPGIRIALEERLSQAIIDAVSSGEADIGIFAENIPAPMLDKAIYRQDRLVLLVPPAHPLASRQEIAFADTLDFDYVGLNQGSSLLARLTDAAAAAQQPLRLRFQVSSFDGICRMIEAGLGIGVLPEGSVRAEILGAGLRALQLTDSWAMRTLWVGKKAGTALQPEAAKLFTFLCEARASISGPLSDGAAL
jgi:DNA-binding transcriptional LysR family regulator